MRIRILENQRSRTEHNFVCFQSIDADCALSYRRSYSGIDMAATEDIAIKGTMGNTSFNVGQAVEPLTLAEDFANLDCCLVGYRLVYWIYSNAEVFRTATSGSSMPLFRNYRFYVRIS
ncbi:hypothetical protein MPH_06592 [Macrophomina phaseolina MS6]|uniref:Uncharacterized protein n=1 Tax=Macrophomina phaseolina (strain MS6) TaxID=1126212 RepID=K2SH36_MACPH|nr:hypothetical protein MPH_06592 [Macrophomina phaseolina MS6]